MATDNVPLPAATGKAATREVSYSGELAQVQAVGLVAFSGSDDAKTAVDLPGDSTDGMKVQLSGALTGALTESAPGTDTASSGLNGRLQRIAQRLTSMIALLPTALGANGGLKVEGVASGTAVPVSGTVAISGTVGLTNDPIKADEAAFTLATDKVSMQGAYTVAHGSAPDAAAAGLAVARLANRHRVAFSIGGHPNVQTVRLQFTAAQTDVSIVGTINSGTKVVVTSFQFTLDNASTVFPLVRIGFGATNTPTTSGVIGAHGGVPAGGGFGRGDGSGMLGVGGDGEELRITTTGAATGNGCELVVTYYTIES